jgi:hypothetical protein
MYWGATTWKGKFAYPNLPAPPAKMRILGYVNIREKYGIDIRICPKCKGHYLELVATHYRVSSIIMADEKHTEQGLATRFLIPKSLGRTQMNYNHA